jgi:hypothetical protein
MSAPQSGYFDGSHAMKTQKSVVFFVPLVLDISVKGWFATLPEWGKRALDSLI